MDGLHLFGIISTGWKARSQSLSEYKDDNKFLCYPPVGFALRRGSLPTDGCRMTRPALP